MKLLTMLSIVIAVWDTFAGIKVNLCVGTEETIGGYETITTIDGDATTQIVNPLYEYPLVYSNCDLVAAMNNFRTYCSDGHFTNRVDVLAYNAGSIFGGLAQIIRPAPYGVSVDFATGWKASSKTIIGYKTETTTTGDTTTQIVTPLYRDKYVPTTSSVDYAVAITNFYKLFSEYQGRVYAHDGFQSDDKTELCELGLAQNMESMFKKLSSTYDLYTLNLNGIVVVTTDIKGGAFTIPEKWPERFPKFVDTFGSDRAEAVKKASGKIAADGSALYVWQDYVAGTDPTDENDTFKGIIEFVNGKPVISYAPVLNAVETAKRKYTTWGKVRLQDEKWTEVDGDEVNYNFFKVTVEMR